MDCFAFSLGVPKDPGTSWNQHRPKLGHRGMKASLVALPGTRRLCFVMDVGGGLRYQTRKVLQMAVVILAAMCE
eukprot:1362825-Amphidinium_carterae.1